MKELMEKVQMAMDSTFIGEIQFTEDEMDDIKSKCKKDYKNYWESKNKKGKYFLDSVDCLIVLIVSICKSWDTENESIFWNMIFEEIFEGKDLSLISSQKLYHPFEEALKRHNKKVFISQRNRRMFRDYFLLHALAPKESLESFIRLLWDWYTNPDILNFNYQQDDETFESLSKYLNQRFKGNNNDPEMDFGGKLYSIRSSFKYLYKIDPASGVKLLKNILYYIDDRYRNGPIMSNSYLANVCNETISNILFEINDDKAHKSIKCSPVVSDIPAVSDIKKIKVFYEYDKAENKVYLSLPEIRQFYVENNSEELSINNADEYNLEIYINDQIVDKIDGYVVGNEILKKIKSKRVELGKYRKYFTENINLKIILSIMGHGKKKCIYDSRETLYRQIIIFNNSREVEKNTIKPDNNYYLMHPLNENVIAQLKCEYIEYTKNLFAFKPQNNDRIITETRTIHFCDNQSNIHVDLLNAKEIQGFEYSDDEEKKLRIKCFKEIPTIMIWTDQNINLDYISIKTDSCINTLKNSTTLHGNEYRIHNELFDKNVKIHTVELLDVSKNQVINAVDFFVDSFLNFTESKYIFDDNRKNIKISNGESTIYDMMPPLGMEELTFPYENGYLIYKIPNVKWRIDSNSWNYSASEESYWKNDKLVHNNCILEVINNSNEIIKILANKISENKKEEKEEIQKSRNEIYKIGDYFVKNRNVEMIEIGLQIGMKYYELFSICNKPKLFDIAIDLESKQVDLENYYCGDKNCKFNIRLENDSFQYEFVTNINGSFEQNIEGGMYSAKVSCIDSFGNRYELFDSDNEEIMIGNPDIHCFTNRAIKLVSFRSHGERKRKIKLKNTDITNIKYDRPEKIGREYSVYKGVLNIKKQTQNVEIWKKDDKYLRLFYLNNNKTEIARYDEKNEVVTLRNGREEIIEVYSFAYEVI